MEFGLTSGKYIDSIVTDVCVATSKIALLNMHFCNHSSSDVFISLFAVKNGNSYSDSNIFIKLFKIYANDTFSFSNKEKFMLNTGDKIIAICSVPNVVNVVCSLIGMPVSDTLLFGLGDGVQLGTSSTPIYTATEKTSILGLYLCNTSETMATYINIRAVKNGDDSGVINEIIYNYRLAPLETFYFDGNDKFMLGTGDKIEGFSLDNNLVSCVPVLMGIPLGG